MDHKRFMDIALADAETAGKRGDRPIACVIVHGDTVIATGSSRYATADSDVHHAENTAVLSCARHLKSHGRECVLYTTLEPCVMCLGTILMANIRNIVFALEDRYMRTRENMSGFPWVRDRIFNYVCGVRREESKRLIETYCGEKDRRLILEAGTPAKPRYHHIGIPTTTPVPGEKYLKDHKVYHRGFETSEFGIEWMRYEEGCALPEIVKTVPHVAFEVDDIHEAIKGKKVIIPPNSPSEGNVVAFIEEDGAPIEFIQVRRPG